MIGKIPHDFPFPDYDPKTRADVLHTCIKMNNYFRDHDSIAISVSGGSDSDCIVHLVCKYFPEYLSKCKFVFVNTGLEYDATKRHLCDLEKRYGITIDRIRGQSVVTVTREYGVPILSKIKSRRIREYCKGLKLAENIIFGDYIHTYKAFQFTDGQKQLAKYIKENGIKISEKCCDLSKKKPLKKYERDNKIEMYCTGERKAEGGQRAVSHNSCFEQQKGIDKYMPLFWWSDETKRVFKKTEGIRYSDCYEVYGMKRTGCVGCPFSLSIADNLQAMYEYEPRLFKACMNVFGQAYELTDRFNCRRKKCLPDSFQMTLTGEIERNKP